MITSKSVGSHDRVFPLEMDSDGDIDSWPHQLELTRVFEMAASCHRRPKKPKPSK